MANVTYTVKNGDTLSAIARKYSTTVSAIASLNNIDDPDKIYVGEVLIISGTGKTRKSNKSNIATIERFGLQSGTDRTVFATWNWNKDYTENYEVKWLYATGDGVGFTGNKSTVEEKVSTYSAPENATHVAFYVRPISKKRKSGDKEVSYWTADWSTVERYYFKDNPPSVPPKPSLNVKDYTVTAELFDLDVNGDVIDFQLERDYTDIYWGGEAKIVNGRAAFVSNIAAGHTYRARCRTFRGDLYSDWSPWSDPVLTKPDPTEVLEIRAISATSVYMDWKKIDTATQYEIQYTASKSSFDSSNDVSSTSVESVVSHVEIKGLDSGQEWFFRVRVKNEQGDSPWSGIVSITLGTAPAAPTTWSSTATVTVGDDLTLYWMHNTEDGSRQTQALLELDINGKVTQSTLKFRVEVTCENCGNVYNALVHSRCPNCLTYPSNPPELDKASSYVINTSTYEEGAKIKWRVKTMGIISAYGEWSIQRTVDIYAPPTLDMDILDYNGNSISYDLESLPFYISGYAGPSTQDVLSYHFSIVTRESYETVDDVGNVKTVSKGEVIYSKHIDTDDSDFKIEISASDVTLENNVRYTLVATVAMNSGLSAEVSKNFTVSWSEREYWPNAEIGYNPDTYSTFIRPYCEDENGALVDDLMLSVYRREFDGSFTELIKDIDNTRSAYITDPHPSLDYARYRIVARSMETGAVGYYDVPGYPINEPAIIIQWDEAWSTFDITPDEETGDEFEKPMWTGSLLRLPYNVDVSSQHSKDVDMVKYIGREHPVSYYGTHIGETASWSSEIPKSDKETIYALRRLERWMGDVYVREPSGTGYWASISVSFSQTHCETTVPVSLDITRVDRPDGGA